MIVVDWLENSWKKIETKLKNLKQTNWARESEWWWWWRVKWRGVEHDHGDLYIFYWCRDCCCCVIRAVRDTKIGIGINLRFSVICDGWERYGMVRYLLEIQADASKEHVPRTMIQIPPIVTSEIPPRVSTVKNNDGRTNQHFICRVTTLTTLHKQFIVNPLRVYLTIAWNEWPNVIISSVVKCHTQTNLLYYFVHTVKNLLYSPCFLLNVQSVFFLTTIVTKFPLFYSWSAIMMFLRSIKKHLILRCVEQTTTSPFLHQCIRSHHPPHNQQAVPRRVIEIHIVYICKKKISNQYIN